ncbi:MAG: hypothetical protein EOP07_19065 [Proteobacteria bacterium]|nr:MAG: hypothetical protein EOP07_19065 [Pseudomonadota bacterium]
MKMLLTLSFLLASSAMAKPVATIKTSGGFTAVPTTRTLTVDANGQVNVETVTTSWEQGSKPVVTKVKVAKLNPSVVAALLSDIAEANNTNVVAENPEAPECMDAPAVVFSALKDGALVEIGKKVNCKSYYLEDYQGRTAMTLLESLQTISYSAK